MVTDKPADKKASRSGFNFKPVHALVVVVLIGAILGVIYMATSNAAAAQVVAVGDNISVYYTGTLTNGTVFDSNVGKQALNFTVGAGEIIKGFDNGVIGMKLDQNKTITIPPNEAYGAVNQSLIIEVPRSQFGNQTVKVGGAVSTAQGQSGIRGIITAINATQITIDFNPPLAGKTLTFTIKVVSIKK